MSNSAITTQVVQLKVGNVQNQADSSSVYSAGAWDFKNASAVTSVKIDNSGNVGIGTVSPDNVGLTVLKTDTTAASGLACKTSTASHYVFVGGNTHATTRWRDNLVIVANGASSSINFETNGAERMRIDASGRVGINTTANTNEQFAIKTPTNYYALAAYTAAGTAFLQVEGDSTGITPQISGILRLAKNGINSRSINASGTINANGADYAEYMTKAGDFVIAKGDICGVNSEGKLTKTFSEAVAFMVKSTNPSFVGGDSWGADLEAGSEELEAARQLVDRIAFCGQVPVNVLGATPGQWIIPVEDNGGIKGEAVSSPSFEQYQKAVGKVIAVEKDGRARIIVKIA